MSGKPKAGISLGALLVVLTMAGLSPCRAVEGGVGAYWPGYRSFMTGVIPPKPGLYIRKDFVFYSASTSKVVLNGLPVQDVHANVLVDIIDATYVFKGKFLGAKQAAVLIVPTIWGRLSGSVGGVLVSGNRFAPGNLSVAPLYLGWDKGNLHYNANIAVFIPTSHYHTDRVVNTGVHYWTFDPEVGITYADPKSGYEASGAIGYSINTKNDETNYRSGDTLHLDYALGKQLDKQLKAGIVGYAWVQVTGDSGAGALFGPFRSRVFGIGPGVQWHPAKGPEFRFRYYHEFGAKNRLEGNQFALTARVAFL